MKNVHIEGMICGHCAARIKSALEALTDKFVEVNLDKKSAIVDDSVSNEKIIQAISAAGYKVTSIE